MGVCWMVVVIGLVWLLIVLYILLLGLVFSFICVNGVGVWCVACICCLWVICVWFGLWF